MACKHPRVRYDYPNGDFKILSLETVQKNGIKPIDMTYKGMIPERITQFACKECIACRLNYSASWANRLSLELKELTENKKWFVTLTYADEYLHTTQGVDPETGEIYTSNRLDLRDIQNFFKRLRKWHGKKFPHEKIRDYYCGEYGSKTHRAHYHAIIWHLNLDENKLEKFRINEAHQQLWKCPELEKIWQKGHVVVGKVSWESIAYVARYMMKKQKGEGSDLYYALRGQIKEFCHMSTHPGIARDYYEAHKNEIYEHDEIAILKKNGAFKIKPPRYFDTLYDIEEPEKLEEIKKHREEIAKKVKRVKLSKTTLSELELLEVEERSLEEKSRKLVRCLD